MLEGNNRKVIFASHGLLLLRSSCPSQPYHNCHFWQLPTTDAKHFSNYIIREWFCTNDTSEDAPLHTQPNLTSWSCPFETCAAPKWSPGVYLSYFIQKSFFSFSLQSIFSFETKSSRMKYISWFSGCLSLILNSSTWPLISLFHDSLHPVNLSPSPYSSIRIPKQRTVNIVA